LMVKPVFSVFADLIPGGVHFRVDSATLLFLLLAVGFQAMKASLADPVRSLRTE
jgi:hypothetical protein